MTKFELGQRVKAVYPNSSWGEGVVVEILKHPDFKPLVVRQASSGMLGYFMPDQVEVTKGDQQHDTQESRH